MMEEYIEVMKFEVPPEIEIKYSGHYQTGEEKLFIAEYGNLYDNDTPLDPLQMERREMLQKQAFAVREKYGIRFEDVFTQNGMDSKYGPGTID
jgi:hypothetical protein